MKRVISVLPLVLLLMPALFASAYADEQGGTAKRWNIMLVVDGSGSLFSGPTTDPDGLRFEAIDDLLGILQDNGNNVGAIVFSANPTRDDSDQEMRKAIRLNTGMISFDGKAPNGGDPKDYINSQLRNAPMDYGSGGTTDIGTALLVAEEMLEALQEQNGLESMVFLFTDGETELNYTNTYEKSIENMHEAEQRMLDNNIKLCGVFLNKDGRSNSTEVRDMVCAANGVASNTLFLGDTYIEIENSTSCHAAMEQFMRLLGFSTTSPMPVPGAVSFRVPGTGAEEANIRIYSTNGSTIPKDMSVSITSPSGVVLSGTTVEAICRSGRTFRNYKLVNPESGTWTIQVDVTNEDSVGIVCELVFSMDKEAEMVIEPAADILHVNMEAAVEAYLTQNGEKITEPADYREYTCDLVIRNLQTNEETSYALLPDSSNRYQTAIFLDTYGTFEAYIAFNCDSIAIKSGVQALNLENHAPEIMPDKLNIKYGLFTSSTYEYDLAERISDLEDGKALDITVDSESCNMDAVRLEGTKLIISSADIGNGELRVTVQDSQGATDFADLRISTKNITLMLILAIIGMMLLIFAALILIMRSRPKLNGKCILTIPCNGSALDIELPTPGSQGPRSTNLTALVEMEKGDGGAIHNVCRDNATYDYVVKMLDNEELEKIKLSIVKGRVRNESGKTVRTGRLKVKQGKAVDIIFNGSMKLSTNTDGFSLAYYYHSDESEDDNGWNIKADSDMNDNWNVGFDSQNTWPDDDKVWN